MIFVLLSIFCSVLVSVILKLSRRYEIPTNQLIAWNYPTALLLNILFYKPDIQAISFNLGNTSLYLVLGFLLPALFLAIAASIRYTGIVRTEIAQRISIFIPLIAAFLIFNETPTSRSILGIAIGLLAIFFSIRWVADKQSKNNLWLYPLIIFLGMGIIDILFKQVAQHTEVPYTSSVFFIFLTALIISFGYIGIRIYKQYEKPSLSAFFWGIGLGIFNFGNILFYLKAHNAIPENPSIVFSAMNVGVIALGALVGLVIFKEKLTVLNKIGILLAILAILIIAGNESI
ncbi:EamA family transporter [Albibacterium bauzanense]|uniref:EamA-like transporter family protein n=1 Tax=Albibacterium bauzanense TaxID=653929 RepID=A0A4R1M0K7_9SPHI|nr:EamA family transporter [Albibacterium bauzanense]TCK85428.1 EamA-like transporter family protein [Albibacterium bauzanense]